jgi:hypothetical protein
MANLGGRKTFDVDGVFYPITSDTRCKIPTSNREPVVAADGIVHFTDNPSESTITVTILVTPDVDLETLEGKTDCTATLDYGNGTADQITRGFVNVGERDGAGQVECVVTGTGRRA